MVVDIVADDVVAREDVTYGVRISLMAPVIHETGLQHHNVLSQLTAEVNPSATTPGWGRRAQSQPLRSSHPRLGYTPSTS